MTFGKQLLIALVLTLGFGVPNGAVAQSNTQSDSKPETPQESASHKQLFYSHYDQLVSDSRELAFCANVKLTPAERAVDCYLKQLIAKEQAAVEATNIMPFARPFLEIKEHVTGSPLYQVVQSMPKGGSLHLHGSSAGRIEWVMTNALLRSDCFIYWPQTGSTNVSGIEPGTLHFGTREQITDTNFVPAATLREQFRDQKRSLETEMYGLLTMKASEGRSSGWPRFMKSSSRTSDLGVYVPVAAEYFQDAFESLCAEEVYYVELRVSEGTLRDQAGNPVQGAAFYQFFRDVRKRVQAKHPQFNLKLILCAWRGLSELALAQNFEHVREVQKIHPDLIVGADLVGEENTGPTLHDAHVLLHTRSKDLNFNLFLHDGESAWANDRNLFAAVLIRPMRIGHGFNLFRFPLLERLIIQTNIALEICPISNQSLDLVRDLRVHPAAGYMSRGVQCVLGSDDPLYFGNSGLAYDFWVALVGWDLDLSALKRLARNSLTYTALPPKEKQDALDWWEQRWGAWINSMQGRVQQESPACLDRVPSAPP